MPEAAALPSFPLPVRLRLAATALGYGAVAGAVAGVTLAGMHGVQRLLWSEHDPWGYIALVILAGGALLAVLRGYGEELDLDGQIAAAERPWMLGRRRTLVLAASGIIAVGFGGAVGPEAGLLAVVAELSALVSARLARNHTEQRLIGEAGNAAALAGLYGSPPGAVAYDSDGAVAPAKIFSLIAAVAGFAAFLVVNGALGDGHTADLGLAPYDIRTDGLDLLWALGPALLASAVAVGYSVIHPLVVRAVAACGPLWVQTMAGTAVFAAAAALWPRLRFSGHEDIGWVAELTGAGSWAVLAGFVVAKPLALAVCLASGWRGGEFFPLLVTGAAAGALVVPLLPEVSTTAALVAGLAAAATVGMRKPVLVLLVGVFVVGQAYGPLLVGVGVAAVVLAVVRTDPTHQ